MQLVVTLTTQVAGQPLLVVVTCRVEDGDPCRVDIPGAQRIALEPLDAADAAEVVRLVTPARSFPPELIDQIVTRCEGNPLYLEEATRAAIETAGDEGKDAGAGLRVPTSLQGLVQTRLDRLPSVKPIIQAASVVGRDVPIDVLELLLPERADIPQAIALLVERELLVREGRRTGAACGSNTH